MLGGCTAINAFGPAVTAREMTPGQYIALKRGDVLTTGQLSAATRETIDVAGLAGGACTEPVRACVDALAVMAGISEEQRQSAMAEVSLSMVLAMPRTLEGSEERFAMWMEVARHSYAYLFFSERHLSGRGLEDRQTQVRDYYNLATQESSALLYGSIKETARTSDIGSLHWGGWSIRVQTSGIRYPGGATRPVELVPASSQVFAGLRSIYRRDGLGAELVAVTPVSPVYTAPELPGTQPGAGPRPEAQWPADLGVGMWSEMPSPVISVVLSLAGEDLPAVMSTREAVLSIYDPLEQAEITLRGQRIPLTANFTAGYGLWLSRSGFNRQSLRALLGRADGIERPHLYLLQPFDPNRRILLMIHGLASSPEAWTNVANELIGDEDIRKHFQIWLLHYPTNIPIVINHYAMRQTVLSALRHFDPQLEAPASRGMVVAGHSMGGVIARLMVSSSGDALEQMAQKDLDLDAEGLARLNRTAGPLFHFEPMPMIERAIFLAAPHRGTDVAGGWLVQKLAALVRLPLSMTQSMMRLLRSASPDPRLADRPLSNSIQNLDKRDAFIVAAAGLPISPRVRYHSIIANNDPGKSVEESDDRLVPYWSSHLPGAESEKIIASGHSVQETVPAIIELRRILHEDMQDRPVK